MCLIKGACACTNTTQFISQVLQSLASCVRCLPHCEVIAEHLQILSVDTGQLHGSRSADNRIHRQMIWRNPIYVGLSDMGFGRPGRDLAQTTYDKAGWPCNLADKRVRSVTITWLTKEVNNYVSTNHTKVMKIKRYNTLLTIRNRMKNYVHVSKRTCKF